MTQSTVIGRNCFLAPRPRDEPRDGLPARRGGRPTRLRDGRCSPHVGPWKASPPRAQRRQACERVGPKRERTRPSW